MAGKGKAKGARGGAPAGGRKGSAARIAEPPLHELTRDRLSVFLYVSLLPEETRALVKEQGLSVPGFRAEALGDVERCDVLADEIRANPPAGARVQAVLEKAFRTPPLASVALPPAGAAEFVEISGGDAPLALALWRVL